MEIVNLIDQIKNFAPYPGRAAEWKVRSLTEIAWCLIHHTAGPGNATPFQVHASQEYRNFGKPTVPAYAPRVTYTYLISELGNVFKCNKAEWVTWHCPGKNRNGLSICLIGNRSIYPPTAAQWSSLVVLCKEVKPAFSIPLNHFDFHRNHFSTQCPGFLMNLDQLRTAITIGS